MKRHILVACALAMLTAAPAHAEGVVAWPTEIADHFTADPSAVLGPPNGTITGLGDYHYVWVRNFSNVVDYSDGLGAVLGLAPGELANWDIIAFEGQSSMRGPAEATRGWESSLWFFTDQERVVAAAFNENTNAANPPDSGVEFRTGTLSPAMFNSFFGASSDAGGVSWILIRLPDAIDTASPTFSVWVSGALVGEGSPDPDAIGVIR